MYDEERIAARGRPGGSMQHSPRALVNVPLQPRPHFPTHPSHVPTTLLVFCFRTTVVPTARTEATIGPRHITVTSCGRISRARNRERLYRRAYGLILPLWRFLLQGVSRCRRSAGVCKVLTNVSPPCRGFAVQRCVSLGSLRREVFQVFQVFQGSFKKQISNLGPTLVGSDGHAIYAEPLSPNVFKSLQAQGNREEYTKKGREWRRGRGRGNLDEIS